MILLMLIKVILDLTKIMDTDRDMISLPTVTATSRIAFFVQFLFVYKNKNSGEFFFFIDACVERAAEHLTSLILSLLVERLSVGLSAIARTYNLTFRSRSKHRQQQHKRSTHHQVLYTGTASHQPGTKEQHNTHDTTKYTTNYASDSNNSDSGSDTSRPGDDTSQTCIARLLFD